MEQRLVVGPLVGPLGIDVMERRDTIDCEVGDKPLGRSSGGETLYGHDKQEA